MIKGCQKGHNIIRPEDNFCWFCGSPLENIETLRCNCGNHFQTSDIFCTACGISKEELLKQREEKKKRDAELLKIAQERK